MTVQSTNPILISENRNSKLKDIIKNEEQLLNLSKISLKKNKYAFLKSSYFASLRHKDIFYSPHYFNATPEQKICIIDIILLYSTLGKREQLITEFELMNRDCQQIRSILINEYQNCQRIFNDGSFGLCDYKFVHLLVYKKIKAIPTYKDSFQVIFSIKPLIITLDGAPEFDIQQKSRVDIIPIANLPQYLQNWKKEVTGLGQRIYNKKKFAHFDAQDTFDNIALWTAILYLIPTELNIFLLWNLWYFSFEFLIFLFTLINFLWPLHSFIRFKVFSKLCKEELLSHNWVSQCNYLPPFSARSSQLFAQPLEKSKAPANQNPKTHHDLTQIFKIPQSHTKPPFKPTTETSNTSKAVSNTQSISEPATNKVMEKEIETQNIEKPLNTTQKTAILNKGIKKLLGRKPKHDVDLGIYKEQLGDFYSRFKIATDFEIFKQYSLRIINLILICEWFKLTGNPPINFRIKEVTNEKIDLFSQIENLLRQFLDKYPDALDVEEMYRIATIINMGHLNQKIIEHIEWKIEDWLLNLQLLPEDKIKVLYSTHCKKTNYPDKPNYKTKDLPSLTSEKKQVEENDKTPKFTKGESTTKETKTPSNNDAGSSKPTTIPTKDIIPSNSNIEEKQGESEILQEEYNDAAFSENLKRLSTLLNQTEENTPKRFIGDTINAYHRFKGITQEEGYKTYPMPVCVFAYDSSRHLAKYLQEFIEISNQITGIVYYCIFDYDKIDPQTVERENIEPLAVPTVWIRDQKSNFDQKITFSTSALAEILADLRESFKNNSSAPPVMSKSVSETNVQEFERIEGDSHINTMDLGVINEISSDENVVLAILENIEKTAQVYEANNVNNMVTNASEELEILSADTKNVSETIDTISPSTSDMDKDQTKIPSKPKIKIQELKEKILKILSEQPMNQNELRRKVGGKHQYINISLKELANESRIVKDDKKWKVRGIQYLEPVLKTQNISQKEHKTSVLEIVFGAFHSKKGPIVIFPLCNDCEEKYLNNRDQQGRFFEFDLNSHLNLTNCKCPLSKTQIPRDEVRKHLLTALKTDEFNTISGKYTYSSWRWIRKEVNTERQELNWAILVYMDPKNPIYNNEREIIQEFVINYQFNIEDDLKELINQGFKQNKLDEMFYERLYDHLSELTIELTTTIDNKTKNI